MDDWSSLTDLQVRQILRDHEREISALSKGHADTQAALAQISRRLAQIMWIAMGIFAGIVTSELGIIDAIKLAT